jgi:hypothetical protein
MNDHAEHCTDFTDWYAARWPLLSAGGVWLRGGELNTVLPAEWERRPYRVLVTRLSTYRDTAVSTSHLLIHALLAPVGRRLSRPGLAAPAA